MKKQTICLNMIVKDESAVIRRCFDSVKDIIDYWVIVDTGSTDFTKEIIEEFKKEVPGELHEIPWKNFAWNRSEAIKLAKDKADYTLIIDADEVISKVDDFEMPELTADCYSLYTNYSGILYTRTQLVSNKIDWRYESVIHEYITCDDIGSKEKRILIGLTNNPSSDGSRSRDPNKFRRDALVLETALLDEPDNTRYMFYLAQSYKDAGDLHSAIDRYQKRIEMGGWDQEIYYSYYMIAELMTRLGLHWSDALGNYLVAHETMPHRLEPIYKIVHKYRTSGKFRLAYDFANMIVPAIKPEDLFVEQDVYNFNFWDEYYLAAYYCGEYENAHNIMYDLIMRNNVPIVHMERMYTNLKFVRDKLEDTPTIPLISNEKNVVIVTGISDYGRTIVCNLLNQQNDVNITHEYSMRSDVYQDTSKLEYNGEQINMILNSICTRSETNVGDGSGVYLNAIDHIVENLPDIKIILVNRNEDEYNISDEIREYSKRVEEITTKYPNNTLLLNYIDIAENEEAQETMYKFIGLEDFVISKNEFVTMLE